MCDRSECDSSFAYHPTTFHSNKIDNRGGEGAYAQSRSRAARLSGGMSGEDCSSEFSSSHASDYPTADAGGEGTVIDDCDSLAGAPSEAPSASCAGSSAIGSVVDYRYEKYRHVAYVINCSDLALFISRAC